MPRPNRGKPRPPTRPVVLPANLDQFWSKVSPEPMSGCFLWSGAISGQGYGLLNVRGCVQVAHRISYAIHNGQPPLRLVIDHKCRNRACVNPRHLEAVTEHVNVYERACHSETNQPIAKFCKRGHPRTAENTVDWGGSRRCLLCNRDWVKDHPVIRVSGKSVRIRAASPHRAVTIFADPSGHAAPTGGAR